MKVTRDKNSLFLSNYKSESTVIPLAKSPAFSGTSENPEGDDDLVIIEMDDAEIQLPVFNYNEALEDLEKELHV